jgi:outer membrane protein
MWPRNNSFFGSCNHTIEVRWYDLEQSCNVGPIRKPWLPFMHRSFFVSVCIMSALFIAGPASLESSFAQTTETNVLPTVTLDQVIEAAKAHYPAIKAAQAQQQAAQGAIGVAKTAYLPRTDLLWQTNRATANNIYGLLLPQGVIPNISGPVIASDATRSAWSSGGGALFSWQPFDFGVRSAKVTAAREGSEAAKQASALTTLDVTAAAGSAFLDLAAAQQLVTVAQANVHRYETFDKTVHVLVDNSLRPGADASQADAQLALAQNQLIQAQTQEAIRRSALAVYLQIPSGQVAIDASPLLKASPPSDPEATEAKLHPFVLEENALSLQQEAQKRVLDRSYVPVFSTLGTVSGRGAGTGLTGQFPGGTAGLAPDTFNWAAGVQVTFAAFDFFNLREQKKVQDANVQAEHARYDLSLTNVSAAIEQTRASLSGARQIAANTPLELSSAQASEQQQQVRYRSGLATVVDVASAEGVLAQAEADDVIARLGIWRAELGVAAAQGDLQPFLQMLQSQAKGK